MTGTGPLSDAQERQVLAILDELQDVPMAEREDFLEQRLAGDDAIRNRVLSLFSRAETAVETGGGFKSLIDDKAPPERIGPWRVVETIGQGGMGVVYKAIRDDGAFEQTVAIKTNRTTSAKAKRRLQAETQILANLSHPNIAQVYDGGEAENGDFFIVMEFLDAPTVYKALVNRNISAKERLDIFETILDAVAYAHQNGIVHRDLSPTNVLVREDNVVKLIDFGISGSLASSEQSDWSKARTKDFTAPERVDGSLGDTRSDIYSLGRLLNLLIGQESFARRTDLLAIIGKASASVPQDRYASIDSFKLDLQHYRAGRPVTARSGAGYYLGRFVSRFPFAFTAVATALIAIVAGLVVTTVALGIAQDREAEAVDRFDALASLSRTVMTDIFDEISAIPGTERAQSSIVEIVVDYLDQLERDPRADSELRIDIAEAHLQLAWLKGYATQNTRFDPTEAEQHWQTAVTKLDAIRAEYDETERWIAARAWAELWHGQRLGYVEYDAELATAAFEKGIAIIDRGLGLHPDSKSLFKRKLSLQTGVAEMQIRGDDHEASIDRYQEMMETAEAAIDILDGSIPFEQISIAHRNIARVHQRQLQYDLAEDRLVKSLTAIDRGFETENPRRVVLIGRRARIKYSLANMKRSANAPPSELLPFYADAIAAYEDWRLVDPGSSTPSMMIPVMKSEMALPLAKLGRREEAIEAVNVQLDLDRRAFENDPARPLNREYVIFSLDNAIPVFDALDDSQQACKYASELIALSDGYDSPDQKTTNILNMTENAKMRLADC